MHKVCKIEERDEEFACVCREEAAHEEELRLHAAQLREQLAEQRRVQERLRLRQQVLIDMRSLDQMVRPPPLRIPTRTLLLNLTSVSQYSYRIQTL